jgi:hypothetical protein
MNERNLDSLPKDASNYIRKLRIECRDYRVANKELSASQEELKAKLQAMQSRIIQAEAKARAMSEGLAHPDWIGIADLSEVTLTDSGEIVGLSEVIERFKAKKPHLFRRDK